MKKLLTALLSVALISQLAVAQNYEFKVMGNKGANEVKSGANWEPLKVGATLQPGDEIKVSPNAYIALVHSTGKPLEWKEAGNFKVADLASNVSGGSSVVNKYTDFILSNNSAEAKKNRLSATGAVTRATGESIKVFLPGNQDASIFNSYAIVRWDGEKIHGPYIVSISSMFGDELAKIETDVPYAKLDMSGPAFNEHVLISVYSKANPRIKSEEFLFKKLTKAEHNNINAKLGEILQELKEETALNKFILAGFYEESGLIVDALTAYNEAIALAPDVPSYQEAYDEFLQRYRMK